MHLVGEGKAPKEIYAILTVTLVCFLPGRAKDLSAILYLAYTIINMTDIKIHYILQKQTNRILHILRTYIATFSVFQSGVALHSPHCPCRKLEM